MEKTEKAVVAHRRSRLTTRQITKISALAVMAFVLMILEIGIPFFPGFLKLDLSDLPALVGAFAMGPVAGIFIQFVKVVLHGIFRSWSGGVGELANFMVGVFYVVPAALVYHYKKDQKHAVIGMLVGTLFMTLLGSFANYYVLIPMYSRFMPIELIVDMGTVVNSRIVDVKTLVIYGIAPFNVFKGLTIGALTLLIYKRISPLLKEKH